MKNLPLLTFVIVGICATAAHARDVLVNGYQRSDGTHVDSYHRTAPDETIYNNYGVAGNPYKSR